MSAIKENQDPNVQTHASLSAKTGDVVNNSLNEADGAPQEPPKDPKLRRGVLPNPLVDDLRPDHLKRGVLIPLKTTQEVRQDHTIVQAIITRAPTRCANSVIT